MQETSLMTPNNNDAELDDSMNEAVISSSEEEPMLLPTRNLLSKCPSSASLEQFPELQAILENQNKVIKQLCEQNAMLQHQMSYLKLIVQKQGGAFSS